MNTWEKLEQYGRHGDTMMKKIDGEPAHVNAVEYEMSPEYIKEHGAGTINPITGKKEYFLPLIGAGLSWLGGGSIGAGIGTALGLGSSLFKGFGARGNKSAVQDAKTSALGMYEEQVGLLEEQKEMTLDKATMQFQSNIQDVSEQTSSMHSKANMATVQPIENKFKDEMTKLFETRDMASSEADLAYRRGEMSADEAYQSKLDQLSQVPTTFLEGVFG